MDINSKAGDEIMVVKGKRNKRKDKNLIRVETIAR
jgi:hypothetical protein